MIPAVRRLFLTVLFFASLTSLAHAENPASSVAVSPWLILPFILLLLAIAIVPFINRHWWERNYPYIAVALGLITVSYYMVVLGNPARMFHTANEYISFIALIGSLFVVSGGIHIRIKGKSTPHANVFLLAIGAVISNILGTTGASMILIRPYLRANKYRIRPHHVVFFIFIVSNMGGALTPIGDPPLFLGYLNGVPFFWVAEKLWLIWAIAILWVLGLFYLLDTFHYRKLPHSVRHRVEADEEVGEVSGMQNIFFLVVILVAVFITRPPFLREVLMILAAVGSYATTQHEIHRKNEFNFIPLKEVAILFLGIFATMVPALDWLEQNASSIGIHTAGQFYWATGSLSAFLDNAPTYLNYLSAEIGLFFNQDLVTQVQLLIANHGADVSNIAAQTGVEAQRTFAVLQHYHSDLVATGGVPVRYISVAHIIANHPVYLQAISIAAVFFGACTYIGNGPNFMVKSIAEQSSVHCPTFFGYILKYTIPALIPIFVLVWFLFFRG